MSSPTEVAPVHRSRMAPGSSDPPATARQPDRTSPCSIAQTNLIFAGAVAGRRDAKHGGAGGRGLCVRAGREL